MDVHKISVNGLEKFSYGIFLNRLNITIKVRTMHTNFGSGKECSQRLRINVIVICYKPTICQS